MTNHRRIALALNNLATVLQQLAVELTDQAEDVVLHPLQLTTEQLRTALVPIEERMAQHGLHVDGVPGRRLTDPPASVAEPECGCSLYTRCDHHENTRPKGCKCNGPDWPSSACPNGQHRANALAAPHHDVAKWD